MAKTLASLFPRPLRTRTGAPKFRHDPGVLPANTQLVHKPIANGPPFPDDRIPESIEHVDYGQQIFMYSHIHTNQVLYSLTRHLNNNKCLQQLPFLGKKTKPARLRKDVWLPFCLASFPSPHSGMEAWRKLREYKRLHETEYDLEDVRYQRGRLRGQLMGTKARGKKLMDQKANSVADLAEVLLQQEDGPVQRRVDAAARRKERWEHLKRVKGEENLEESGPVDLGAELKGTEGVVVQWADLRDAEFAEVWPEPVIHGDLQRSRYTAAMPRE